MSRLGPGAPEPTDPGAAVPGSSASESGPSESGLGGLDLRFELTTAGAELHHHLRCGDREVADLLGAWIDALLDEWNRRRD